MASVRACSRGFHHAESWRRFGILSNSHLRRRIIDSRRFLSHSSTPPLNVALPDMSPGPSNSDREVDRQKLRGVQVTKLSNGIRVASEDSHGPFCTLGGNIFR